VSAFAFVKHNEHMKVCGHKIFSVHRDRAPMIGERGGPCKKLLHRIWSPCKISLLYIILYELMLVFQ